MLLGLLLVGCAPLVTPLNLQDPALAPVEADPAPSLVTVSVCWSAEPLGELLASAYQEESPGVVVQIQPTTNDLAFEAVTGGVSDLAVVAVPMGDSVLGPEMGRMRPLARDGIALVSSPDSALTSISLKELSRLYQGYREIGADEDAPTTIISRERGAVTRDVLERVVLEGKAVTSSAAVATHDRAMVSMLSSASRAMGYVPAAFVQEPLRIVALDGLLPTTSQLARGRYPLALDFYLVESAAVEPAAAQFVRFAMGGRGRRAIENRYVRLR